MGIDSTFKDAIERATSPTLVEPDWAAILQACDSIRQKDVTGKVAVSEIRKRIFDSNPHVAKNALITLEACVKNCGSVIHDEVATKAMMDDFRQLVNVCPETVKTEVLRIINAWAYGFRNEPKYRIVEDTRNLMKMEGFEFPERNESDAMFSALKAPDWADGDVCHRCRVKFGTFTRQHHCRCCGQVFCAKCSSKNSVIAKFGIEREVRVCDPCYDQLNPSEAKASSATSQPPAKGKGNGDLPPEYLNSSLAKESQVPEKKSDEEIKRQEQEDLQLAMALSVSEQETKQKSSSQSSRIYDVVETRPSAPAKPSSYSYTSSPMEEVGPSDSELDRYLNRSYWEKRKKEASPPAYTSPTHEEESPVPTSTYNGETIGKTKQDSECEAFMATFRSNVEKLMERMKYVAGKGRHISSDSIIQSLYQTVSAMQPQLMNYIEQQERQKDTYEMMEEKLGVLQETRRSLDEMRVQRREKLRQQELEQDMLRRMQMEQKMELLRQQKQEYLLYQQQLQTQRQQALEQMAKEQAMGGQVSSYGAYQPSRQVAGDQPAPPNYQSLTPNVQPHPGQRQGQPPYQPGNQYEAPNSQFQNLSLQNIPPVPNPAQPAGNPPQTQSIISQGQTTHYLQPSTQVQQDLQLRQPTPGSQPNQYQVVNEGPRQGQSYAMGPDYPSSGPMSYQNQPQQNMYTHTPPSSGPPSMESYSSGPNSLQDNMTGGVTHGQPQSFTGPPPTQTQPPQPFPPGQGTTPTQQFQSQQVPPPQLNQPQFQLQQHPYSQHAAQSQGPPPQQNIQSQGPPTQNSQITQYQGGQPSQSAPQGSGASSLQYQNQPVDPTYQQTAGQQPWVQGPNGNYQQQPPPPPPPPSYGDYEPVQQPYNQQQYGQQQFYEQNVAETPLISFD
ncbi:hepatocyte growth factor-regulated tyrosine kinase substrate-like [Dendronephthya gigantea]|uniref:hepatocyte growth factor-regulated tyrosine kinase substrate-like n=1 Tax=Dendronephthya gigantea TaxID=151771 RepID=UPI00106AE300|nr:hepatocyte growth factor-regulated tyrosine kinase substrate-like [Dendronephthya gigantea]